jgi:cysteine-rich repeat protein
MRLGIIGFLTAALGALVFVIVPEGCAPPGATTMTSQDRICTPGDNVFCRCADQAPGTKKCQADGRSFDTCVTSDKGECVGGEIPDPNTNEPIDSGNEPMDAGADAADAQVATNSVDSCPGKSTAVQGGVAITLSGDTTNATEDHKGRAGACAVGLGGKDHVYHLIPTGSGSLDVKVQGEADAGLDPVAYLRTTCDDEDSQVSCGPVTPAKLASFKVNVVTGRDYFLFVDGASSTSGKYSATLKLTTGPFCGDGKVDTNEACDDGNKVENDGCSNSCKKVDGNPMAGGMCPGHPVDVWPGQTVTGAGSTNIYGNAWNAPSGTECGKAMTGTNDYQDHIYAVTPHDTGNLVVTVSAPAVGPLANHMISARTVCATPSTDAAMCVNAKGAGEAETLTIPVTKDKPIFVTVDGGGDTSNTGDYSISFKITP